MGFEWLCSCFLSFFFFFSARNVQTRVLYLFSLLPFFLLHSAEIFGTIIPPLLARAAGCEWGWGFPGSLLAFSPPLLGNNAFRCFLLLLPFFPLLKLAVPCAGKDDGFNHVRYYPPFSSPPPPPPFWV